MHHQETNQSPPFQQNLLHNESCGVPQLASSPLFRTAFVSLWKAIQDRDWISCEKVTKTIARHNSLSEEEKVVLLTTPRRPKGFTPLHTYASTRAPDELISLTLEAINGAPLLGVPALVKQGAVTLENCTPLHLAFSNLGFKAACALIRGGHPLNLLNSYREDPVVMMLKHSHLNSRHEEDAVPAVKLFYECGGFVGHRDLDQKLAFTLAIQRNLFLLAKAITDEHLRDDYTATRVPVRSSEVQAGVLYTSLRAQSPKELVESLVQLGRKSVSEEFLPTPAHELTWTKILLDFIPGIKKDSPVRDWKPLHRILDEFQRTIDVFDELTRKKLLNARVTPKSSAPIDPRLLPIYRALSLFPRAPEEQMTFGHLLLERDAPEELFIKALRLGLDVHATCTVDRGFDSYEEFNMNSPVANTVTLAHLAARKNKEACLRALIEMGADLNAPDSRGFTVLRTYLEHDQDIQDLELIDEILTAGGNITSHGGTDHDLSPNFWLEQLLKLRERSRHSTNKESRPEKTYSIYRDGIQTTVTETDLHQYISLLSVSLSDVSFNPLPNVELELQKVTTVAELSALRKRTIRPALEFHFVRARTKSNITNLYHRYLALKALREIRTGKSGPEYAFTKLLPHLLFNYPVEESHRFAQVLEHTMDTSRRNWRTEKRGHPNAVELMTLLLHPRDERRNQDSIGPLTTALTSISYFVGARVPMTGAIANLWGEIGTMSFSALNFRFDAEKIRGVDDKGSSVIELPSLLERYGMKYYPAGSHGRSEVFGPSFILAPGTAAARRIASQATLVDDTEFSPDTYIELHRGLFVISHPTDGTLVVRNSSPVFGRDLIPEPAYWSPCGIARGQGPFCFTAANLFRLTPTDLKRDDYNFTSVLDFSLYEKQHTGSKALSNISRIKNLVKYFQALKTDFARWKFDSIRQTAWERDLATGEMKLVGGYNSPGFSAVVDYLEKKYRDATLDRMINEDSRLFVPDLAFVNRHHPAWSPYSRLIVSEETLKTMRTLAKGQMPTQREVDESQVFDFFREGLKQDAELVLLSPKEYAGDTTLR